MASSRTSQSLVPLGWWLFAALWLPFVPQALAQQERPSDPATTPATPPPADPPASTSPEPVPTPSDSELQIHVHGAQAIPRDEWLQALAAERSAWKEGLAGPWIADDCAYEMEQYYLRRGYARVRIRAQFDPTLPAVTLHVEEGQPTRIVAWRFEGTVDQEGLREPDLVALYRPSLANIPAEQGQDAPPFVEQTLKALPDRVLQRYRSRGYLDAQVSPPEVEALGAAEDMQVTLRVVAGPQYRLGTITHDVPPDVAHAAQLDAALRAVVPTEPDEPQPVFDPSRIPQWARAATQALGQAGYLDATATVETQIAEGRVQVHVRIQPGEIVRLGDLELPADLGLRASFVRQQIELQSGDLLTPQSLDSALVRLYRTGRFEQVRLQTRGEGPVRDLVMTAQEQAEREAFLEPGYGSFERGRLRAGWRHYNVGGVARSIRVEGTLAEKAERLLVAWNDPWSLPNDWVLDVNLDTQLRKLPAYDRTTRSAGAFVSRSFGEHLRWTTDLGLRHARVRVRDVRIGAVSDPALAEDLTSTTLEWGLRYDSRSHPLLPRSGQLGTLSLQQSLIATGSASPYSKLQLGWSHFTPISDHQVLGIGLRSALVFPEGGDELPLGLRLFSGGENSVRSFRESELGPKDANGVPLGGEASTTLSIEFLQDLGESRWQAAVFADLGNVLTDASDWADFSDMEGALGVGARYLLPIGPVRLDWGIHPNPGPGDPASVLHLSVGMAF